MIESLFSRAHVVRRLQTGLAGPYLESMAQVLQEERYQPSTICRYLRAADSFGRWLRRHGFAVSEIDQAAVNRYLSGLGRRRCASRPNGRLPDAAFGVDRFLQVLRQERVIAPRIVTVAQSAADEWLVPFAAHLTHAGLSQGTRRIYLRYARAFLETQFGSEVPDVEMLTAEHVTAFVRNQAGRLKSTACRLPVTAVRVFLRFLALKNAITAGMEGAIPVIRQWKLAALPQYLSEEEVSRVLATCDDAKPVGRRDRAILITLVRLGLRAGEVLQLALDDIDWLEGHIRIRAGKSGRERVLPLSEDVGRVIVAYLQEGRPQSDYRHVFLRCRPPHGPFRDSSSISGIAKSHMKQAGLSVARMGAHTFRHTAATHMVCGGATFKEVADILGHARLQTTAIYAKLDLVRLASVAMPWSGGGQ